MKMSLKLSEEQISGCRRGSDIDIEAIFGGHISGERSPDVRVNPVFLEKHKSDGHGPSELDSENNNEQKSSTEILANQSTGNQSASRPLGGETNSMVTKGDSQNSSRSERESLKVTNGNVLVGDIVIENGYKNQGFEGDVVTESATQRTTNQTTHGRDGEHTSVNSMVQYFDGKVTDSQLIISRNNNNESDWPDLDAITVTVVKVADPNKDLCDRDNSDPGEISVETNLPSGDVNHNTFQGDDEKNLNKVDDNFHSESNENGITSLENGDLDLKSGVLKGKEENSKEWTQVNGSEVKSVKKIKERKNSVPEHIQNCVSVDRPKGIKPILVSGVSVEEAEPTGEQSEQKSVKFSDDTVFNDGRPNKYRRDTKLVNLRDIYKGKVNSDYGLAKPNPIFLDDSGLENSLTDDEKVARNWGQVKGYVALPTCLNDNMTLSPKHEIIHNKDLRTDKSDEAIDIESVGTEEKPRYDRLIKRTIARQRRSKLIRLIFSFVTFLVVIAVVVLLVIYFGKS
ncbi:uncharacterized protein LOC110462576 isoform X1 [Mizuhopecten yessoensis]|uniref:uncharacterized protein LOC110462576 isoform X1 n=1 Tax=Mizuhopecten yessoensis TaxID=6573 RepID=UPI000B4596C7|nr:uncharacterized protein LOC110462576 isoform X1 [Mizuhopecten yessoensis]XP_021372243.1 uncharacterized protein LOC110462576 isoform X1 [Mizuhopecten yessoensis]XP_021372245.1 uncharacterized protein LOC110462576 isoform X1 [Mizuhopecten yessoensis]XP_021372246.1 uncharacterized protein LOC110462576 isoform X1 [Mizuhopecten yessoensis]XP_021372247.1 uncharacterized protein LOC110462576 isoform X1 [Mizuhopecten yessoensis]